MYDVLQICKMYKTLLYGVRACKKRFAWLVLWVLVLYKKFMRRKKSKYQHVKINKKRFYFYKISWLDITADGGHATADEFDKFECSKMISFAYIYKRTKKFIWTFASYDEKDEAYSDRNIFPVGCILKLEKRNVEPR